MNWESTKTDTRALPTKWTPPSPNWPVINLRFNFFLHYTHTNPSLKEREERKLKTTNKQKTLYQQQMKNNMIYIHYILFIYLLKETNLNYVQVVPYII